MHFSQEPKEKDASLVSASYSVPLLMYNDHPGLPIFQ